MTAHMHAAYLGRACAKCFHGCERTLGAGRALRHRLVGLKHQKHTQALVHIQAFVEKLHSHCKVRGMRTLTNSAAKSRRQTQKQLISYSTNYTVEYHHNVLMLQVAGA